MYMMDVRSNHLAGSGLDLIIPNNAQPLKFCHVGRAIRIAIFNAEVHNSTSRTMNELKKQNILLNYPNGSSFKLISALKNYCENIQDA